MSSIEVEEGRSLFGADPRNYDESRPPYPQEVYDFLRAAGALGANTATLEIGAGSGVATRRLLELGADPLTVVEPDARFAPLLRSLSSELELIIEAFEDARLPRARYDLVVAASSFHWVRPEVGIAKVSEVLRPGGYAALWWHVFGDSDREDAFHEATKSLLEPMAASPSGAPDAIPHALDVEARLAEFAETGAFQRPRHAMHRWTLVLNPRQVAALYATFSPISRLPEPQRQTLLRRLEEIAERQFGGRVERNMVTPIYLARRRRDR